MSRKFFILVFLLFWSFNSASAQKISAASSLDDSDSLRNSYVVLSAVGELTSGNVRVAYDLLQRARKNNPHSMSVSFYLAKTLLAMDRSEEALAELQVARAMDSTNKEFLNLEGQLLINLHQYQQAQVVFEKLISNTPSDGQNYVLASALAIEQKNFVDALAIASRYEALFGFDERIVEIKRVALIAQKRYYEALEYMQTVVAANPTQVGYLISLGDVSAGLGLDRAAVDLYQRAVALDSSRADGYMALAKYYDTKGDMARYIEMLTNIFALEDVDKDVKIRLFESSFFTSAPYRDNLIAIRRAAQTLLLAHSEQVDVRLLYGRFLTYIGQIDAATDHYQNMLQAGIASRELYDRIMEIQFYRKDYPQALATATTALALWPDDGELLARAITAQWQTGDVRGAERLAKSSIKRIAARGGADRDSLLSSLYALSGDIAHETGNDRRAFAHYERALRLTPDNALVLNNFAYYLSLLGRDLERALLMAERACTIQKDYPTYIDTKAWVLFCLARYEEAAGVQKLALSLDRGQSSELMLHYGDILYALGDDFMARTYWKKALDAGAVPDLIDQRLARPKATKSNAE
ncbi:MAG: tetratricopeptide repeat protein [Mucinivorans sp.]